MEIPSIRRRFIHSTSRRSSISETEVVIYIDGMGSASALTRRSVVIHFDLGNHEDVVLAGWSGRPFRIAVAANEITIALARDSVAVA